MAEQSKALLIAQLDAARRGLIRTGSQIHEDLDVPKHVRSVFVNHKGAWLGGAAAFGWVLARLPRRKKKTKASAATLEHEGAQAAKSFAIGGVLLALARMIFTALRPTLTAIATRKIKDMAAERIRW